MEAAMREIPHRLFGRVHGPLSVRLIMHPLVMATLAIPVGFKVAREWRPAFGCIVPTNPLQKHKSLRESWQDVSKVFVAVVISDIIHEVIVFRRIYPGQTLIIATILALLPYLLIHGPVNRIAQRWQRVEK